MFGSGFRSSYATQPSHRSSAPECTCDTWYCCHTALMEYQQFGVYSNLYEATQEMKSSTQDYNDTIFNRAWKAASSTKPPADEDEDDVSTELSDDSDSNASIDKLNNTDNTFTSFNINTADQVFRCINNHRDEIICSKSAGLFDPATDAYQFHCKICGRKFMYQARYKYHLECHMRKNTNPFTCTTCGETFGAKNGLRNHRVKHLEDSPFACDLCSSRFRMQHHLKHHRTTHFKKAEFTCKLCGKAFGSLCSLRTHESKSHHGSKKRY